MNGESTTENVNAAERSVLGAMLLSEDAITDVAMMLTGPMFKSPAHELIYDAIMEVSGKSGPVDVITVGDQLTAIGEADRAGGSSYLHQLIGETPAPANAAYYAHIVVNDYAARESRRLFEQARYRVEHGEDAARVKTELDSAYDELTRRTTLHGSSQLADHLDETTRRLREGTHGHTTGLRDWDDLTGGFAPGTLNVLAARPGMGKTAVALHIARANADKGVPVLFLSLEMGPAEILTRIIAAECMIPSDRLKLNDPQLTDQDWEKIERVIPAKLDEWKFYLHAETSTTVESFVAEIRSYQRQHPDLLVVIDYLQLMDAAGRYESRQTLVSAITRKLKAAALTLQVPIVLLAQLNRESESRADKRPVAADLRESGSVEQDADLVALLHREDVYDKESPRAGEMDIIIAKNRSGATRTLSAAALLHYMDVRDMAYDSGGF